MIEIYDLLFKFVCVYLCTEQSHKFLGIKNNLVHHIILFFVFFSRKFKFILHNRYIYYTLMSYKYVDEKCKIINTGKIIKSKSIGEK